MQCNEKLKFTEYVKSMFRSNSKLTGWCGFAKITGLITVTCFDDAIISCTHLQVRSSKCHVQLRMRRKLQVEKKWSGQGLGGLGGLGGCAGPATVGGSPLSNLLTHPLMKSFTHGAILSFRFWGFMVSVRVPNTAARSFV